MNNGHQTIKEDFLGFANRIQALGRQLERAAAYWEHDDLVKVRSKGQFLLINVVASNIRKLNQLLDSALQPGQLLLELIDAAEKIQREEANKAREPVH